MIIEILAPTNYTILFLGIMKKKPIEELVHDYWDSWDYFADIMMKKPISKNWFMKKTISKNLFLKEEH